MTSADIERALPLAAPRQELGDASHPKESTIDGIPESADGPTLFLATAKAIKPELMEDSPQSLTSLWPECQSAEEAVNVESSRDRGVTDSKQSKFTNMWWTDFDNSFNKYPSALTCPYGHGSRSYVHHADYQIMNLKVSDEMAPDLIDSSSPDYDTPPWMSRVSSMSPPIMFDGDLDEAVVAGETKLVSPTLVSNPFKLEPEKVHTSVSSECLPALEAPTEECWTRETDESQDSSLDLQSRMLLIYSKHRLMARLMQEVYVVFDKRWSATTSSRAGSEASGSSSSQPQHGFPGKSQSSQKKTQKRGSEEQDPDDNRAGKRRRSDRPPAPSDGGKTFACPFHQKDPVKYSCNSKTGLRYRACMAPGFENTSRLKYAGKVQHLQKMRGS